MRKIAYLAIFGFICMILWVLNNPDPAIVEKSIEKVIGVDVPSEFEVVNYKEGGLMTIACSMKSDLPIQKLKSYCLKLTKNSGRKKVSRFIAKRYQLVRESILSCTSIRPIKPFTITI